MVHILTTIDLLVIVERFDSFHVLHVDYISQIVIPFFILLNELMREGGKRKGKMEREGGEREGVRKNYKLKKEAGIDHSLLSESLPKERKTERKKDGVRGTEYIVERVTRLNM